MVASVSSPFHNEILRPGGEKIFDYHKDKPSRQPSLILINVRAHGSLDYLLEEAMALF